MCVQLVRISDFGGGGRPGTSAGSAGPLSSLHVLLLLPPPAALSSLPLLPLLPSPLSPSSLLAHHLHNEYCFHIETDQLCFQSLIQAGGCQVRTSPTRSGRASG